MDSSSSIISLNLCWRLSWSLIAIKDGLGVCEYSRFSFWISAISVGPKPQLYVVENELAAHDPLRHIAVQILEFSLSFESEPLAVKRILLDALNENSTAKAACEQYASHNNFRGLDHLLEHLVFDSPFSALVVIDEMPENLQNVLSEKFKFGVEVLELAPYKNDAGEYA